MKIIGRISNNIEQLLNLSITGDKNIYLGETNINHMAASHPSDYLKYKDELPNILSDHDYVGINPKDNSLEYVKEYIVNGEYVKVAVRISSGNRFYARSLYVLNKNRVINFIKKGTLKKT